jgi:hypothetical protein
LRKLCLALPEAQEVEAWGAPTFRGPKKMFAMFASAKTHHGRGRPAVWFKATPADQARMIEVAPECYFVPPYVGKSGWVGAWLDNVADWDELAEFLRDAYRSIAPRRLLDQL